MSRRVPVGGAEADVAVALLLDAQPVGPHSLEGLTLKLKLHEKSRLIGKDLMLGKTEGKRRRGQQRMRWLYGITDSIDINLGMLWGRGGARPGSRVTGGD